MVRVDGILTSIVEVAIGSSVIQFYREVLLECQRFGKVRIFDNDLLLCDKKKKEKNKNYRAFYMMAAVP